MNQAERQKVGEYWLGLASMYGKEINQMALKIMLDSVSDLPAEKVLKAFNEWSMSSKQNRHPLPADIREMISPNLDQRAVANDLVRKIDRAIMKHGYVWQEGYFHENGNYWQANEKIFVSFKEAVIEEVGPIGWHVLCSRGGWANICRSSNEMEEGQFVAQLRDQIQGSMSLAEKGIDVSQIDMPKPSLLEVPGNVHELIKTIEQRKN